MLSQTIMWVLLILEIFSIGFALAMWGKPKTGKWGATQVILGIVFALLYAIVIWGW